MAGKGLGDKIRKYTITYCLNYIKTKVVTLDSVKYSSVFPTTMSDNRSVEIR